MGWGGVRVDVCCGKGGPAAGRGQRAFCAVRISLAMSSSLRPLASLTDGIAIWGTVRATSVRIITADWPTMVVGALNEAAAAKRESISCESRWHRPRGCEINPGANAIYTEHRDSTPSGHATSERGRVPGRQGGSRGLSRRPRRPAARLRAAHQLLRPLERGVNLLRARLWVDRQIDR